MSRTTNFEGVFVEPQATNPSRADPIISSNEKNISLSTLPPFPVSLSLSPFTSHNPQEYFTLPRPLLQTVRADVIGVFCRDTVPRVSFPFVSQAEGDTHKGTEKELDEGNRDTEGRREERKKKEEEYRKGGERAKGGKVKQGRGKKEEEEREGSKDEKELDEEKEGKEAESRKQG